MNPGNVKSGTYIDFNKKNDKEYPNFEVDNHVKMSRWKEFLQKFTLKAFMIKKLKNTVPWS